MILLLWKTHAVAREIYISPSGSDYSNCTKKYPCKTLDNGFTLASVSNSARLILSNGSYTLNRSHSFTNKTTFGLSGTGATRVDVIITCDENVSLSFVLSENITFERVTLQKCGGWYKSTFGVNKDFPDLQGAKFKTALYFRYCRNLQISDVEISSSTGLGANLYDVGGFVSFVNSVFANNTASNNRGFADTTTDWEPHAKYMYSGGGVFLMLNPYSNNTMNVTPEEHDSYQHGNHYLFFNCRFLGNVARWSNTTEDQELYTPARPFSRGGGLAVLFAGNSSRCKVEIQRCIFSHNNASWGGGLQVEIGNFSENNTFWMEGTIFRNNVAALAGGGARVGNVGHKGVQLILNRFHFINCLFIENTALWGGGASIYGTTIPRKCTKHTDPVVTQFYFNRCKWQKNSGNVGAAMGVYLYNQNEDQIGPEVPFHVQFDNDTLFELNVVHVHKHTLTIGQGALYSAQVPLIFKNSTKFLNNSKSALLLDGSTLKVHDEVEFINNTGFRGGAIAMYGRSRIIFYPNAVLNFERNTCEDKGGALYIQTPGPPLVSFNATGTNIFTCFFGYSVNSLDYNEWNTSVTFIDNNCSALYSQCKGKSVYVTTLKSCWRVGENRTNNSVLKWKFVKFDKFSVATDPVDILYDKNDWHVAPGEFFDANVKLLDELNNTVQGVIDITISSASLRNVTLYRDRSSCLFLTNDEGKIRRIFLSGHKRSTFSLQLNCIGSQLLQRVIHNVTLRDCYDGFIFSDEKRTCRCMNSTDKGGRGVSRCEDGKTLYVKHGYWAGEVEGKSGRNFSTYVCPPGYCNKTVVLNSSASEYNYTNYKNHVCWTGRNQSSTLCGKCENDYSITIGGEQCKNVCSNFYLFLIIPYAVGFLLVVIIIMLIDLDVFTGYFNAWLYSYQVMKLLVPDDFDFNPVSEFVINLSNIQIDVADHGFCFAKGIDDADKLMLMYAIPVYVILLVIVLAKLVGAFPEWCFSKRIKAPFRGICTIFVLCYTDITSISLKILRFANVGSKNVLYANGSIEYFSGKHLYYGIIAVLVILLFVIPFPLILLFRPYLTNTVRPVLNLNRWTPFFDALQSCFKDHYRWCAAFYFSCRLGILVIYTYMPPGPAKRLLLEGVCILILLTFALLKPYKEAGDVEEDEDSYEWMNKSDVALLTTLSFIAVVSSPLDNNCVTTQDEMKGFRIVVNILSGVPVAVLLAVGYRAVKRYLRSRTAEDDGIDPAMSTTDSRGGSPVTTPETSVTQRGSRGSRSSRENRSLLGRRPRTPQSQYGSLDTSSVMPVDE